MATNYPINPRVRAFGKARIDIAERAKNQGQWDKLWKQPSNPFPFAWGESWKQCVEYRVDDFPAEIGFYIDILGLPINALDSAYAMFTSPKGDFFFSVVPTPPLERSTPPDAFRLQFMVKDITATTHALQQRGIDFEQTPQPLHPGSSLSIASFRTPHGICVELWGRVEAIIPPEMNLSMVENKKNGDDTAVKDDDFEDEEEEAGGNAEHLDEDEENDELLTKSNGNGDEEFDEDSDEDDISKALNGDEEGDEDEFDQDEDDFDDEDDDDGENFTALKSVLRMDATPDSATLPDETKAKSPNKMAGDQQAQAPEYIDLEVT